MIGAGWRSTVKKLETITHTLPHKIAATLENVETAVPVRSRLGNEIWFVSTKDGGDAVLKIGNLDAEDGVREEASRLIWLQQFQLTAPKIIAVETVGKTEFVLMTLLRGEASHIVGSAVEPEVVIKPFAQYLRQVHSIPVETCPFGPIVSREIEAAILKLRMDQVDRQAFIADVGLKPELVLSRLEVMASIVEENTFTHGDYCLPNLMIDVDGSVGGLDWGLAGISDIHRDFMSAQLTITRNFGKEYVDLFYKHYGISDVDQSKVEFFWLLDRFSSHRIRRQLRTRAAGA
jgi:aminoglycoside phosphotransferase